MPLLVQHAATAATVVGSLVIGGVIGGTAVHEAGKQRHPAVTIVSVTASPTASAPAAIVSPIATPLASAVPLAVAVSDVAILPLGQSGLYQITGMISNNSKVPLGAVLYGMVKDQTFKEVGRGSVAVNAIPAGTKVPFSITSETFVEVSGSTILANVTVAKVL